ncbi:hypothetical protein [Phytoactinopolyspora mesophila]|uniref:Uncharacterized protein n=1 Tax=Phytoactinopolyspora mesophila TaxID=2650750 RepID=A0A7K3MD56_9ACTN|nr:hypothetical protein [Phytoactinopolyspora mesophila]NDL61136.1 hypothetical protein [Phytoactinopolyspora mesophila]
MTSGEKPWLVAKRMGHQYEATTVDLYGWVTDDQALRVAAQRMSRSIPEKNGHDG